MHAPEAPLLFVGTHKDELEDAPAAVEQANGILNDFLIHIPVPLRAILERIKRPSDGKWFFAVDSKSREVTAGGKVRSSDLSVSKIRSTLEQVVEEDKRKVEGLSFALSYVMLCTQYNDIFLTKVECMT